jgi:hypothetical protein
VGHNTAIHAGLSQKRKNSLKKIDYSLFSTTIGEEEKQFF